MKKVSKILLFLTFIAAFLSVNLFVPTTVARAEEEPAQQENEEKEEENKNEVPGEGQKVDGEGENKDEEENPQAPPVVGNGNQEEEPKDPAAPANPDDNNNNNNVVENQEEPSAKAPAPSNTKGQTEKITLTIDNGTGITPDQTVFQVTKGITLAAAAAEAGLTESYFSHSDPNMYPTFYVVPTGGEEIDGNTYVLNEDTTVYVRWKAFVSVSSINITVTAPAIGRHVTVNSNGEPDYVPDVEFNHNDTYYTDYQNWIVSATNHNIYTEVFQEGQEYYFQVGVRAFDGYKIDENTTILLNGSAPIASYEEDGFLYVIGKMESAPEQPSNNRAQILVYKTDSGQPEEYFIDRGGLFTPPAVDYFKDDYNLKIFAGWYFYDNNSWNRTLFDPSQPVYDDLELFAEYDYVYYQNEVIHNDVIFTGFDNFDFAQLRIPEIYNPSYDPATGVVVKDGDTTVFTFEVVKLELDAPYELYNGIISYDGEFDLEKIEVVGAGGSRAVYRGDLSLTQPGSFYNISLTQNNNAISFYAGKYDGLSYNYDYSGYDLFPITLVGNDQHIVNFDSNGNDRVIVTIEHDGTLDDLPIIRSKYAPQVFDDWYRDANLIQRFDKSYHITENTTLYAKYNTLNSPYHIILGSHVIYTEFDEFNIDNIHLDGDYTLSVNNNVLEIKRGNVVYESFNIVRLTSNTYEGLNDKIVYTGDFSTSNISVDTSENVTIYRDNQVVDITDGTYVKLAISEESNDKLSVKIVGLENSTTFTTEYKYNLVFRNANKYLVMFVDQYGTSINDIEVNPGSTLTSLPKIDNLYGNIFLGWRYQNDDGVYTDFTTETPVIKSLTVTPKMMYLYFDKYDMIEDFIYTKFNEFDINEVYLGGAPDDSYTPEFDSANSKLVIKKGNQIIAAFNVVTLTIDDSGIATDDTLFVRDGFDINNIGIVASDDYNVYIGEQDELDFGEYLLVVIRGENLELHYGEVEVDGAGGMQVDSFRIQEESPTTVYVSLHDSQSGRVDVLVVESGDQIDNPGAAINNNLWEHHIFEGWYTDPNFTELFDFANTTITEDLDLYSKWITYEGPGIFVDNNILFTGFGTFKLSDIVLPSTYTKELADNNKTLRIMKGDRVLAEYHIVTLETDYTLLDSNEIFNIMTGSGFSYGDDFYNLSVVELTGDAIIGYRDAFDFDKIGITTNLIGTSSGVVYPEINGKHVHFSLIGEDTLVVEVFKDNGYVVKFNYSLSKLFDDTFIVNYDFGNDGVESEYSFYTEVQNGNKAPNPITMGLGIFEPIDENTYYIPASNGVNKIVVGWYNGDVLYDFNSDVDSDLTLTARYMALESESDNQVVGQLWVGVLFDDIDINNLSIEDDALSIVNNVTDKVVYVRKDNDNILAYDLIIINTEYDHNGTTIYTNASIDYSKFSIDADPKYVYLGDDTTVIYTNNSVGKYYVYARKINDSLINFYAFKGVTDDYSITDLIGSVTVDQMPKFTVEFNTDGGTVIPSVDVTKGEKVERPANDPEKATKIFVGWYADAEFNTEFDFNAPITKATVVYAKYEDIVLELSTTTTLVDFGTKKIEFEENIPITIKVKNTGNATVSLDISNPTSSGPFISIGFPVDATLAPGEEINVTLAAGAGRPFSNQVGTYNGNYKIIAKYTGLDDYELIVPAKIVLKELEPGIKYSTHVESIGWQEYVADGAMAGTSGKSLRLEAIKVDLVDQPYEGSVEYRTHIQNIGWETSYKKDNQLSGTSGQGLRLEAIQMKLTGEMADHYDIYYRVHAEMLGWLGWARNDEQSGTAGYGYRLEGIEIKLVEKGTVFNEYGKTFTFDDKVTGRTTPIPDNAKIIYTTHVESIGWQDYVSDGVMAGTSGKSLRLEGIKIDLNNPEYAGDIEYRTHIQNIGWESSFKKNDEMSGTSGKSLRLEAIEIKLTGEMADHYDVYYRVHAQQFGWLGWARNGEQSGTEGYGYRLEGIEIKLIEKGTIFSEYGDSFTYASKTAGTTTPLGDGKKIAYTTHVESIGWQDYVTDGKMAGTSGQALRLEGIKVKLVDQEYEGDIEYRTHIQNIGWEDGFKKNDQMSGTSGKSLRLEAIEIKLTGEMADHYDVYYRVHAQMFGWLAWAKNGEQSGTAGYGYRLEGIEIVLVEKGQAPPARSNQASNKTFIQK